MFEGDQQIVRQIREIIMAIHADIDKITAGLRSAGRQAKEDADELAAAKQHILELDKLQSLELQKQQLAATGYEDTEEQVLEVMRKIAEEQDRINKLKEQEGKTDEENLTRWQQKIREYEEKTKKIAQERKGGLMGAIMFGQDMEMDPRTGKFGGDLKTIQSMISTTQNSMFGDLAAGGWLAVLLYGIKGNMDDSTLVNQFAHKFRQIRNVASDEMAQLGSLLKNVKMTQGGVMDEKDLAGSADAFVGGGFNLTSVMEKYNSSLFGQDSFFSNMNNSVLETATLIDKTFSLGSGTAAKAIVEFANTTGSSLGEATAQIEALAVGARMTGTNFAAMLGVMQQVTTASRFNAKEVSNLVGLYAGLKGVGMQLGLTGEGASQLGLQVFQNVAGGAVDRLAPGMMAVLGGDISSSTPGVDQVGGLGNMFRMLTGFRTTAPGKNGEIDVGMRAVELALARARRLTPGEGDDAMGARTLAISKFLGTNNKDSAMLALMESMSGGKGLIDPKALPKEMADELKNISGTLRDQRNPIERLLDDLKKLVQGVIQAILTGVGMIVAQISLLTQKDFLNPFSSKNAKIDKASKQNWNIAKQQWMNVADTLGNTGNSLGGVVENMFNTGLTFTVDETVDPQLIEDAKKANEAAAARAAARAKSGQSYQNRTPNALVLNGGEARVGNDIVETKVTLFFKGTKSSTTAVEDTSAGGF